ncbi:LysR substrate-binding domain-containing protein [Bacillus sp. UNCCL81]|uniref:LysR substrate-binding domain-containing protein n=1 Tax=Bacillus sp. UNCCL81 TaxID=1502755 RepID=UPI000B80BD2E
MTLIQKTTISSTADLVVSVLPEILILFKRNYPKIDLIVTEKDADEVLQDVKEENVDLGLTSLFEETISDSFETLFEGHRFEHFLAFRLILR